MARPWCIQACFSPGSILSKLKSQPVQHAYSVANHPHGEQTHLCLCVYVGVCVFANVRVCFFHLQIKCVPHSVVFFFFFLTASCRASVQSDNKHATSLHTANHVAHTHINLCLSSLVFFTLQKVSTVISKMHQRTKHCPRKSHLANP